MTGETWIATHHLIEELKKLRENRKLFIIREEENLHPFVLKKRLAQFDSEIEQIESELLKYNCTVSEDGTVNNFSEGR